mmetsp:Transcript_15495/g.48919  ORF Transcript_15495/g.48919 Transcript_15495/m.48919 type:complete len:632 (+) Transcript_15495:70-1965(+)
MVHWRSASASPPGLLSRRPGLSRAAEALYRRRSRSRSADLNASAQGSKRPSGCGDALDSVTIADHSQQIRRALDRIEQETSSRLAAIEQKLDRLISMESKLDRLGVRHTPAEWRSEGSCAASSCMHGLLHERESLSEQSESPQNRHAHVSWAVDSAGTNGDGARPAFRRSASTKSNLAVTTAMAILVKNTSRSRFARAVWMLLEPEAGAGLCHWFACLWQMVIVAGVAFALLWEILEPPAWSLAPIAGIDAAFDGLFTLEILLRFYACPDRCAFFRAPTNLVDLMAGPVPLVVHTTFMFLGLSSVDHREGPVLAFHCLVPVLRLLKMLRRFEKFHLLLSAFQIALEALPVLIFTLLVIVLAFSAVLYLVEPRDNIESLPRAMWLIVVTMSTVGYGDTVPMSGPGHLLVAILVIASALYMAMPIGIIGSAFNRVWEDRDRLLLMQRMREQIYQKGYAARDIPELFFLFDADRDGQLSFHEFHQMVSAIQLDISAERTVRLFDTMDRDGSGMIDDREFVRVLFPRAFCEIYNPLQRPAPFPEHEHGRDIQESGGSGALQQRRQAVTSVAAFRSSPSFSSPPSLSVAEPQIPVPTAPAGTSIPASGSAWRQRMGDVRAAEAHTVSCMALEPMPC